MQLLIKSAIEEHLTPVLAPEDDPFTFQRKREELGYELQMKLRMILAELEHELGLLKTREFDPEMLKLYNEVRHRLETIARTMNVANPIKTAREIVLYLDNRHTKAVLENLDFLAEHHLEKTKVPFQSGGLLVHPKVRSFKLIPQLLQFAKEFLTEQSPQSMQETVRPSKGNIIPVTLPGPPAVPSFATPPAPTAPESPEAKKKMEKEVG